MLGVSHPDDPGLPETAAIVQPDERVADCTIAVVSGKLGSTRCEAPSTVVVITELRELVFQRERPT